MPFHKLIHLNSKKISQMGAKYFIAISLIICSCLAAADLGKPKLKDFKKFKLKYGISYASREEESKR